MPIYWSFLILSYFLLVIAYKKTTVVGYANGEEVYHVNNVLRWFPVLYLALFVCLRDEVLDTYFYIGDFNNMPTNWNAIDIYNQSSGSKGFHFIMALFKMYISKSYYLWLTLIGGVSLYSLFRFYRKFSCNYAFTFFLFISSTAFSWLFNGARQFVVACVLIGLVDWFLYGSKKQKLLYVAIAIFMTTIHSSAWFVLPLIYICSRGKMLDKWMVLVTIGAIVGTLLMGDILEAASEVMNKDYDMSESTGSSVMRLLISAVPLTLVLIKLKRIRKDATPIISFTINMSLIGICFYFASTFSNGILVGRMPIYFTLYNYILLPWLLKKYYNKNVFILMCVSCYTFYFYYQMCIAWHHLDYKSIILGLQYFHY